MANSRRKKDYFRALSKFMEGNFFNFNPLAFLSLKGWKKEQKRKETVNRVQSYKKIDQKTATRKGSREAEGAKGKVLNG